MHTSYNTFLFLKVNIYQDPSNASKSIFTYTVFSFEFTVRESAEISFYRADYFQGYNLKSIRFLAQFQ